MTCRGATVLAGIGLLLSAACLVEGPTVETGREKIAADAPADATASVDPLGPNAGCYVCHVAFVEEELAVTHQRADVGCVRCHGPSLAHANDENIGATRPDVVFAGPAVNPFCRSCHATHDVEPGKVVARWLERRPAHTASPPAAVPPADVLCTTCHGRHRITAD